MVVVLNVNQMVNLVLHQEHQQQNVVQISVLMMDTVEFQYVILMIIVQIHGLRMNIVRMVKYGTHIFKIHALIWGTIMHIVMQTIIPR